MRQMRRAARRDSRCGRPWAPRTRIAPPAASTPGLHTFGDNGVSGYLSFTRQDNDKWKGQGYPESPTFGGLLGRHGLFRNGMTWLEQSQRQVRRVHRLAHTHGLLLVLQSQRAGLRGSLARAMEQERSHVGRVHSWADAKAYATSSDQQDEAYWKSSLGARRDHLAYVRDDIKLGEHATLSIQPYVHSDRGRGDWTAPSYGATWSPDPIYFRETQYNNGRYGTNAKLST